ncbi:SusE domain-containing protein [Cyclonatronum proteinivorum]|uniref:SusE domain-containing protein n=1 Tax=Cyclonatronum proteinivorum TaxID=1457365 RepID=UPI0013DF05EF|nr:SusE domain-containing protein [Cyclonatronum proteinivorum]
MPAQLIAQQNGSLQSVDFEIPFVTADAAGNGVNLTIGTAFDATTGYDPQYDLYAPPPGPAGTFDGRISFEDEDYFTFFQPTTDEETVWPMQVRPSSGNSPVTLSWNTADFPEEGQVLLTLSGGEIIDLREQSEFVFEGTGFSFFTVTYRIVEEEPAPGPFNLLTPADGTELVTIPESDDIVEINWETSENAETYTWLLIAADGNFDEPLLSETTEENGLIFTSGALDAILEALSIEPGESAALQWTVFAQNGDEVTEAANGPFDLTLIRGIADVSVDPASLSFEVSEFSSDTQLLTLSNTGQLDATLSVSAEAEDAGSWLSASEIQVTVPAGGEASVSITADAAAGNLEPGAYTGIVSFTGSDTDLTVWVALSVMALPLGDFDLLTPPDGTALVTIPESDDAVEISWEASENAETYTWLLIAAGGSFDDPLLSEITEETSLVFTSGGLDAILEGLSIEQGESVALQWTVFAQRGDQTNAAANGPYDFTLERAAAAIEVSPAELSFEIEEGDTGEAEVTITNTGELTLAGEISIADAIGWISLSETTFSLSAGETLTFEVLISTEDLTPGLYDGQVLITSNAASEPEVTISVALEVTPGTALSPDEVPLFFDLSQNYPNPFNPVTQIAYALPEAAEVRLEVFNLTGQRVALLVEGIQNAGYYTVSFDAARLSSGVYLYRLQAGSFVQTRKMTLVK